MNKVEFSNERQLKNFVIIKKSGLTAPSLLEGEYNKQFFQAIFFPEEFDLGFLPSKRFSSVLCLRHLSVESLVLGGKVKNGYYLVEPSFRDKTCLIDGLEGKYLLLYSSYSRWRIGLFKSIEDCLHGKRPLKEVTL